MNLTKLFKMQKTLDNHIYEEHPVLPGENRLSKKKLALLVEVGECANEWRGFKYWSNDPNPRESLLEEYVDGLHFILSIGLDLDFDFTYYPKHIESFKYDSTVEQFLQIYLAASTIKDGLDFIWLFSKFIGLGEMLGFTQDEIEQAYYAKNAINHQRQDNGY